MVKSGSGLQICSAVVCRVFWWEVETEAATATVQSGTASTRMLIYRRGARIHPTQRDDSKDGNKDRPDHRVDYLRGEHPLRIHGPYEKFTEGARWRPIVSPNVVAVRPLLLPLSLLLLLLLLMVPIPYASCSCRQSC